MSNYVPLSVRHGNRRKKLAWWWKGRRQAVALRLAPWLRSALDPPNEYVHVCRRGDMPSSPGYTHICRREDVAG